MNFQAILHMMLICIVVKSAWWKAMSSPLQENRTARSGPL